MMVLLTLACEMRDDSFCRPKILFAPVTNAHGSALQCCWAARFLCFSACSTYFRCKTSRVASIPAEHALRSRCPQLSSLQQARQQKCSVRWRHTNLADDVLSAWMALCMALKIAGARQVSMPHACHHEGHAFVFCFVLGWLCLHGAVSKEVYLAFEDDAPPRKLGLKFWLTWSFALLATV